MTGIVWPGPHSNNIPTRDSRRADTQSCRLLRLPVDLEDRAPSAAPGCGFCCNASRPVSGRMVEDNETLFTVKGKGSFKGVAHMILIAGKRELGRKAEDQVSLPRAATEVVRERCAC